MGLMECPECGNAVSKKAKSCPNCGYPIPKERVAFGCFVVTLIILGVLLCSSPFKNWDALNRAADSGLKNVDGHKGKIPQLGERARELIRSGQVRDMGGDAQRGTQSLGRQDWPADSPFSKAQVCKAGITAAMGRDPDSMTARENGSIVRLSYVRPSDGTRWTYRCKIEGQRIIWALGNGRWRTHPEDAPLIVRVSSDGKKLHVALFDGDGSVTRKSFTADQLDNFKEAKERSAAAPIPAPRPLITPKPVVTALPMIDLSAHESKDKQEVKADKEIGEAVSIETRGAQDLGSTYLAIVRTQVESNFRHPFSNTGLQCRIGFKILKDGTIDKSSFVIKQSTRNARMDRYAIRALNETGKVPPLYDDYTKPHLRVIMTFEFSSRSEQ